MLKMLAFQETDENNQNIEPEFHSFNYDEQAHQAQAKSGIFLINSLYQSACKAI